MIFCLTSVHRKMLIPSGLMLIVFIFVMDSISTVPTTEPTTQPPTDISTAIALSIVIPLLLVLGIAGFLIWYFIHIRSKGFNFPRLQKCPWGRASEMNATQPDVQQQYICNPQATNCATEQFSSSDTYPTYQVNEALYSEQNYENVMIGPISLTEECVTKPARISPAVLQQIEVSQPMDYDDCIYENNPSMNDSAVYCNYTGQHNDEDDDTYIIPSK